MASAQSFSYFNNTFLKTTRSLGAIKEENIFGMACSHFILRFPNDRLGSRLKAVSATRIWSMFLN